MKKIRISSIVIVCIMFTISALPVQALTPKEDKGVITLKSERLARESPDWFTPFSLEDAPQDVAYWRSLIPYSGADQYDMYIVLPTLGAVAPVIFVSEGTQDYNLMKQGKEIDINKYLNNGVLHYAGTGKPGIVGNPVIFGHSNFFASGQGNYKTIFADIMNLDATYEDEIWIFDDTDNNDGEFLLRKFSIEQSYDTKPTDVDILLPTGGKEMTVFACTNGLEGRWILKALLIEDNEVLVPYAMKFRFLDTLEKMKSLPEERQQEIVATMIDKIGSIRNSVDSDEAGRDSYDMKFKKYLLNYFERTITE